MGGAFAVAAALLHADDIQADTGGSAAVKLSAEWRMLEQLKEKFNIANCYAGRIEGAPFLTMA